VANIDNPHGFNPCAPILGASKKEVAAANSTAIFIGDLVSMVNTGTVKSTAAGDAVIVGATEDYLATLTAGEVVVYGAPDQDFIGQDDASGTPDQSDIGNNCDMVAGTGSAVTLISAHEIGHSTLTTGSANLHLCEIMEGPDLEIGDWGEWRVRIMEHLMRTGKAGV